MPLPTLVAPLIPLPDDESPSSRASPSPADGNPHRREASGSRPPPSPHQPVSASSLDLAFGFHKPNVSVDPGSDPLAGADLLSFGDAESSSPPSLPASMERKRRAEESLRKAEENRLAILREYGDEAWIGGKSPISRLPSTESARPEGKTEAQVRLEQQQSEAAAKGCAREPSSQPEASPLPIPSPPRSSSATRTPLSPGDPPQMTLHSPPRRLFSLMDLEDATHSPITPAEPTMTRTSSETYHPESPTGTLDRAGMGIAEGYFSERVRRQSLEGQNRTARRYRASLGRSPPPSPRSSRSALSQRKDQHWGADLVSVPSHRDRRGDSFDEEDEFGAFEGGGGASNGFPSSPGGGSESASGSGWGSGSWTGSLAGSLSRRFSQILGAATNYGGYEESAAGLVGPGIPPPPPPPSTSASASNSASTSSSSSASAPATTHPLPIERGGPHEQNGKSGGEVKASADGGRRSGKEAGLPTFFFPEEEERRNVASPPGSEDRRAAPSASFSFSSRQLAPTDSLSSVARRTSPPRPQRVHDRTPSPRPAPTHSQTLPSTLHGAFSHSTPFASTSYRPPSGAPGFAGESHRWNTGDWGFDSVKDRLRGEVELTGRREGIDKVLLKSMTDALRRALPPRLQLCSTWRLLYSLDQHGVSLHTLYAKVGEAMSGRDADHAGCLVCVRDTEDRVFGAFVNERLRAQSGYYGSGECFLFKQVRAQAADAGKKRFIKVFKWSGRNDYMALTEHHFLSVGGGDGKYGLWIDSELDKGVSSVCPAFNNDVLCSLDPGPSPAEQMGKFECLGLEVWGVGMDV